MSDVLEQDDVADLRRRLAEAEDTLRAIRDGEVDALVIGGTGPQAVFTLEGGKESWRVFMEAMELGAAAMDGDGRVLFANTALCQLLGCDALQLQDRGLLPALDGVSATAVGALLSEASRTPGSCEIALHGAHGDAAVLVNAAPLQVGPSMGVALTFTDLTARNRAAAAEESERLARAVISSANEAVVVCDRSGRITHVNAAVGAICAESPLGRRFDAAIGLVLPGMPGLASGEDLIAMAVDGGTIQGIEATAPDAPRARDLLVSAAPLVVAGNDVHGCVVTMVDLTQRKATERQQFLLMKELDHRVKNTLALVVSICTRTANSEDTVEGFRNAFLGRIHALAATHTLLADKSWVDLRLKDVVVAELAPYAVEGDARLQMQGLEIDVTPRAATALGLIFHELATNAAKYGAFSNNSGTVSVQADVDVDERRLTIEWTERGGPPVAEPKRTGFGRTVIARSLSYSPEAKTDLRFLPDGVECSIRVPWQDVRP